MFSRVLVSCKPTIVAVARRSKSGAYAREAFLSPPARVKATYRIRSRSPKGLVSVQRYSRSYNNNISLDGACRWIGDGSVCAVLQGKSEVLSLDVTVIFGVAGT